MFLLVPVVIYKEALSFCDRMVLTVLDVVLSISSKPGGKQPQGTIYTPEKVINEYDIKEGRKHGLKFNNYIVKQEMTATE